MSVTYTNRKGQIYFLCRGTARSKAGAIIFRPTRMVKLWNVYRKAVKFVKA